jgi:branched-chain amino acid transport system permease protein
VVVIGGIGSRGALIAALLVGLVDTFGKVLLPSVSGMLVLYVDGGCLPVEA